MRSVLVPVLVLVSVNVIVIGAGCGGSARTGGGGMASADEAPPDPDAPELQVLERFQTLSDYVAQSGTQCERIATSIDSWMDGNEADVTALIERARAEPGLEQGHMARVEERLEAVFGRVLGAVEPCRGTASLDRAFARLDRFVEGV